MFMYSQKHVEVNVSRIISLIFAVVVKIKLL